MIQFSSLLLPQRLRAASKLGAELEQNRSKIGAACCLATSHRTQGAVQGSWMQRDTAGHLGLHRI